MWNHVVILLLALGAVLAYDVQMFKERLTQLRIRSQNLHVAALEREVEELEHEFDQLSAPISQADVTRVKARVENLEGNLCGENEVNCGGQIPECVNHLFFCDGHKDCKNGHDEDEDVCSMQIIRPGSSFKGIMRWGRSDYAIVTTITESRRTVFGPLAWLRLVLTTAIPEADYKLTYYAASGYYSFGLRKMLLLNEDVLYDHLSPECTFHLGDGDRFECIELTPYKTIAAWHRHERV